MSSSPHVIDVTTAEFETAVVARSHQLPVVVDFWADWCQPCRMLGPVLEKLAARDEGRWVLAKVDTQANQDLAQSFGIQGIPNVKAFVNGEVVDEFSGALPEYAVDQWLQKLVPSPADDLLDRARDQEAGGDAAGAIETYIEVLGEDPDHAEARAALISALVRTDDVPEARGLLDEVADHQWGTTEGKLERAWLAVEAAVARPAAELTPLVEGDLEARYELAMRLAGDEQWEEAFELLLHIVATDRQFRDDLGRVAMVRLFEVLGDEDEITDRYRRRMGSIMYV